MKSHRLLAREINLDNIKIKMFWRKIQASIATSTKQLNLILVLDFISRVFNLLATLSRSRLVEPDQVLRFIADTVSKDRDLDVIGTLLVRYKRA
jgi:hypothetical protein